MDFLKKQEFSNADLLGMILLSVIFGFCVALLVTHYKNCSAIAKDITKLILGLVLFIGINGLFINILLTIN